MRIWCASVAVLLLLPFAASSQTGLPVGGFEDVDAVVQRALTTYDVPGLSLAIMKDGRLVLARGYGLADRNTREPMQPTSLVRWNSMSKSVTAVGILKLVEQGKLDLNARVFDILRNVRPYNGHWGDDRITAITVRQLLHHTGGWDRDRYGDPLLSPIRDAAAAAVGGPFLPSGETLARYMIAQPLHFTPGTRFVYSNFGYVLLGLVVKEAAGEPYEEFIRKNVFEAAGIAAAPVAGNLPEDRLPGEVGYYYPGGPYPSTLLPSHPLTPLPYGTFDYQSIVSCGGWLNSTIALAKFVVSVDGQRTPAILIPESAAALIARPDRMLWFTDHSWYGLGVQADDWLGAVRWYHGGASPGSHGEYARFPNGMSLALLANGDSVDASSLHNDLAVSLGDILLRPRNWPETDLFLHYFPPRAAAVVNAASFLPGPAAPDALVSIFGSDLGSHSESAGLGELPFVIADFSARLTDSTGAEHRLPLLYASLSQVNFHLPAGVAPGPAQLFLERSPHAGVAVALDIRPAAPGLFMANSDGLAAAVITRVRPDGSQTFETVSSNPVRPGGADEIYLSLYGTGLRRHSGPVTVIFDERGAAPSYAGAQPVFPGLDQVNVRVTPDLVHSGAVQVAVDTDGARSNAVTVFFE